MLESFTIGCKFQMYMANKSVKFGIKIYGFVEAKSFYTSNLQSYVGKPALAQFNVINFALLTDRRTIIFGTLNKNELKISPSYLNTKYRMKPSSMFGFH